MKIRWNSTGLRLRIGPGELEHLRSGATVVETFPMVNGWSATLSVHHGETGVTFSANGGLLFLLSTADCELLSMPDREGVYFEQEISDGQTFRYYIEKDFPCLHPRPAELANTPTETFPPTPSFLNRAEKA